MLNQFSRTELLLGKEAMERLAAARVAVFGIGGVGGYTVEALVRSGIGAVDLISTARFSPRAKQSGNTRLTLRRSALPT